MLTPTESFSKVVGLFKATEDHRHKSYVEEDEAIRKGRNAVLKKLRAAHTAEEKNLIADWEKEDVKRLKDRLHDEKKATANVFTKIPRLMTPAKVEALPALPPLSADDDEIFYLHSTTSRSTFSDRKRAHSPEPIDEENPTTTMSPFERRRLDNLAKNKALMDDIAPPKTPSKPRQRRTSKILKTPTKTVAQKIRISPRAFRSEADFEDGAKDDSLEILRISSSSGLSSPPASFASQSREPESRTVTMCELNPWDRVIEFPHSSKRYYCMRCAGCLETFDSAAEMLVHLKNSNHRHLLQGIETGTNAVKVCGNRITDATYEWIAAGNVRFISQRRVVKTEFGGDKVDGVDATEKDKGEGTATPVGQNSGALLRGWTAAAKTTGLDIDMHTIMYENINAFQKAAATLGGRTTLQPAASASSSKIKDLFGRGLRPLPHKERPATYGEKAQYRYE